MPLIRSENVKTGDPVAVRVLRIEEGAFGDGVGKLPDDADIAEREAFVARAVAQLREDRRAFEESRQAILDEAYEEARRLKAEARETGESEGRREGERLLAEARAEAETILSNARREGEEIRARSETEGFATGMKQARDATDDMLSELRSSLEGVVEEAHHQRVNLIRNAEPQVVELALEAARRMAAHALRDEDTYVALLRSALSRMLDKDWVRIRVSRADLDRVREMEDRILMSIDGLDRVEVVDDPRVESGLIAETRHGTVDATCDGMMERIIETIETVLREREADLAEEAEASRPSAPPGPPATGGEDACETATED